MPDTLTPAVRKLQARLAAGLPDLCLTGAVAADVFNGVWLTGVDVLITGDRITGLVPTGSVKAREIVDLTAISLSRKARGPSLPIPMRLPMYWEPRASVS